MPGEPKRKASAATRASRDTARVTLLGAAVVPGFWQLAWMIFMKPFQLRTLYGAFGLEKDPSLWRLSRFQGEPAIRALVIQFTLWLFLGPTFAWLLVLGLIDESGWREWIYVLAIGIAAGALVGVPASIARGVALGPTSVLIAFSLLVVRTSTDWGGSHGVAIACAWSMALGMAASRAVGRSFRRVQDRLWIIGWSGVLGTILAVQFATQSAPDVGAVIGVSFPLGVLGLPEYAVEAIWMQALSLLVRAGVLDPKRAVGLLAFRHHDMIFFPLPGLRRILVALGERDPELAQRVITEASETIGQKRPARFALAELQARSLEIAARERLYARTGELALDFIPTASAPANLVLLFTPFTPFQLAARELLAAQVSGSHDHKKRALARARKTIKDNQLSTISGPPRAADLALYRYLPRAHRAWLAIIDEEQARLSRDMRERPQVPTPFVAGPALGPDDQSLFKGRKDLVRLIDHDLTADRRAPLLLCGQRRMGKSSLLRMLPIQLGTGTRVVTLNFQSLSGSPHRAAPHLWLSQKIAAVVPNIPAPPQDHAWMPTLEWLRKIDAALAARDERLLVAIDEVERLQDGIEAGWASTDLLDLIRAAGDQLTRIRMLFVSAHPLPRLGPHWVDRLISVVQREIGYLDPDAACELVCHPTDTFPDIYPDGGADHIVRETRCHPYLIQLVCDELCRGLNEAGRLRATDDDIDLAIERAFAKTTLFDELWRHLDDDEHAWLRRLARALDGLAPPEQTDQALRRLIRERYVEQRDGAVQVAVPMFATWIRSERG